MKKLIISLFLLYTSFGHSAIIPIAGRYDGAGGAYGAAYQEKFGNNQIIIGGVTGDAKAFGGLFTHYLNKDIELSIGAVSFSEISMVTNYQRGLSSDEDAQYVLNLEGNAVALGSKIWLFSDYITTNLSVVQSTIVFNSFEDENGEEVIFDQANVTDLATTSMKLGFDLNFYDNQRSPNKGIGFNTNVTQLSGRSGQSDQMILDYGFKSITPFLSHFSFTFKAKYSDAIVEKNSKFDSEQEIRDELEANCSSVSDTTEETKCEALEEDLIAFILENNLKGQATPLGGSSGLRSFREQRFKAAHTALYSAEINTNISSLFNILNGEETKLVFSIFYDQGYASDDKLKLFDESKFSNGGALRFYKGRGSVNLQAASGSDNSNSWSLGFGNSF